MFRLEGDLVRFFDRPVLSVRSDQIVFSSGCGRTSMKDVGAAKFRMRERIHYTHYRIFSRQIHDAVVRIVLKSQNGNHGAVLMLEADGANFHMRVEGLPWDHNRLRFHWLMEAEEIPAGGRDVSSWKPGTHVVWAQRGNLRPLAGFYTDKGFWLSIDSGALARFHWHPSTSNEPGMMCVETWDSGARIVGGLAASAVMARKALFSLNQRTNQPLLDEFAEQVMVIVDGEQEARDRAATLVKEMQSAVIILADWQGMKRSPFSQASYSTWSADIRRYKNLRELVGTLRNADFSCGCTVLPLIDVGNEHHRDAVVRDYCLLGKNGRTLEDTTREETAVWVDLTNPQAVEWIQQEMRGLVERYGFDILIAQLDAPFPAAGSARGGGAIALRNTWEERWNRICREAFVDKAGIRVFPNCFLERYDQKEFGTNK